MPVAEAALGDGVLVLTVSMQAAEPNQRRTVDSSQVANNLQGDESGVEKVGPDDVGAGKPIVLPATTDGVPDIAPCPAPHL